jgi:glutathione S-transferase-like protein
MVREDGVVVTLVMYERVGFEGRRPSPFSWRIRFALAHKGADVDYKPTRFADVGRIEKLSGQKFVPIVVDGSTVVHDSWNIARYLEEKYPDRPPLFGDEAAVAATRLINLWADNTLNPLVRLLISADFIRCLVPEDRAYFRSSREKAFGRTLEAAYADGQRPCRNSKLRACRSNACSPNRNLSAGVHRATATISSSRSSSGRASAAHTTSSRRARSSPAGGRG